MHDQADVIVIGSGGLGAATAFHLASRGVKHVMLIDRHDIGSQTSPRAAGMVSCVRKSEFMIRLNWGHWARWRRTGPAGMDLPTWRAAGHYRTAAIETA